MFLKVLSKISASLLAKLLASMILESVILLLLCWIIFYLTRTGIEGLSFESRIKVVGSIYVVYTILLMVLPPLRLCYIMLRMQ